VGGAGDQGMMFGYATNETKEMLPIPYVLATKALIKLRDKNYPFLEPDAKAQVTYDYEKNKIDTFLISTQHHESLDKATLEKVVKEVMIEVALEYNLNIDFKVLINPTGRFVIGSSFGDSGVTGRKIIADTYGGMCRHGGGAFSGKDSSKVDRSAAYMCRYVAKNIVKRNLASKCEIQVAYAIGVKEPISINVNTFGTGIMLDSELEQLIKEEYDFTPQGIIKKLNLLNVDYYKDTASYGHFGKENLPWEK
jgi:S-adenosylmethionine synthetase